MEPKRDLAEIKARARARAKEKEEENNKKLRECLPDFVSMIEEKLNVDGEEPSTENPLTATKNLMTELAKDKRLKKMIVPEQSSGENQRPSNRISRSANS